MARFCPAEPDDILILFVGGIYRKIEILRRLMRYLSLQGAERCDVVVFLGDADDYEYTDSIVLSPETTALQITQLRMMLTLLGDMSRTAVYIPGQHDAPIYYRESARQEIQPLGIVPVTDCLLHGRGVRLAHDLVLFGLGGSDAGPFNLDPIDAPSGSAMAELECWGLYTFLSDKSFTPPALLRARDLFIRGLQRSSVITSKHTYESPETWTAIRAHMLTDRVYSRTMADLDVLSAVPPDPFDDPILQGIIAFLSLVPGLGEQFAEMERPHFIPKSLFKFEQGHGSLDDYIGKEWTPKTLPDGGESIYSGEEGNPRYEYFDLPKFALQRGMGSLAHEYSNNFGREINSRAFYAENQQRNTMRATQRRFKCISQTLQDLTKVPLPSDFPLYWWEDRVKFGHPTLTTAGHMLTDKEMVDVAKHEAIGGPELTSKDQVLFCSYAGPKDSPTTTENGVPRPVLTGVREALEQVASCRQIVGWVHGGVDAPDATSAHFSAFNVFTPGALRDGRYAVMHLRRGANGWKVASFIAYRAPDITDGPDDIPLSSHLSNYVCR